MRQDLPVYISDHALDEFASFCQERDLHQFAMVVDANTDAALGARAERLLKAQGHDVLKIVLTGDDIGADARSILQTLWALDRTPRTFVAVGSGTITDVTRFVSHRTRASFIALPTAPSVDGFTSIGAPIIVEGVKLTISTQGPLAVFADLPTLCAAPRPLLAAGFGDLLAKLTSIADWELGSNFWGEPFDAAIAQRARVAAWACAERAADIATGSPAGVKALMEGLIESGFCMLDFGETRPASGYEHHMAHFWEMLLLREGRHSVLHGAKVGLGVLISAQRYDDVRQMSAEEAAVRLAAARPVDREAAIRGIRAAYGPIADQVIAIQSRLFNMTADDVRALAANLTDHWAVVKAIAATVPTAQNVAAWLGLVGAPTTGAEMGFSDAEVATGANFGHYYRDRFSVARLSQFLGIL